MKFGSVYGGGDDRADRSHHCAAAAWRHRERGSHATGVFGPWLKHACGIAPLPPSHGGQGRGCGLTPAEHDVSARWLIGRDGELDQHNREIMGRVDASGRSGDPEIAQGPWRVPRGGFLDRVVDRQPPVDPYGEACATARTEEFAALGCRSTRAEVVQRSGDDERVKDKGVEEVIPRTFEAVRAGHGVSLQRVVIDAPTGREVVRPPRQVSDGRLEVGLAREKSFFNRQRFFGTHGAQHEEPRADVSSGGYRSGLDREPHRLDSQIQSLIEREVLVVVGKPRQVVDGPGVWQLGGPAPHVDRLQCELIALVEHDQDLRATCFQPQRDGSVRTPGCCRPTCPGVPALDQATGIGQYKRRFDWRIGRVDDEENVGVVQPAVGHHQTRRGRRERWAVAQLCDDVGDRVRDRPSGGVTNVQCAGFGAPRKAIYGNDLTTARHERGQDPDGGVTHRPHAGQHDDAQRHAADLEIVITHGCGGKGALGDREGWKPRRPQRGEQLTRHLRSSRVRVKVEVDAWVENSDLLSV